MRIQIDSRFANGLVIDLRLEWRSKMLNETLKQYFPEQDKDLETVLSKPDFESAVRKNTLRNGKHCIKIKFEGRIVAKSVEFESDSERNRVFESLLNQVYIQIHGQNQRTLDF